MSCNQTAKKSNWQTVKLGDIIAFNPLEKLRKGGVAKKVAMEKLNPFTREISGFEKASFSGGTKFKNGDTLLARITPCLENGKTAQVNILDDGEIGFGSTEFIVLRSKAGITNKDFIYYLAISPKFREIAIQSMVGSSGRQRVQQSVVEDTQISLPPLEEQEAIAGVLSSLDDKIELNNKINQNLDFEDYFSICRRISELEEENQNLEAQAQAIFKSWFVDFEPFKNGTHNYKTKTLDCFCNVFTGKKNANASVENGLHKFFTCSPNPLLIDSFIFDGSAIIISGNGSYTGTTRFYNGKFDLYQRTYACTIKEPFNPTYIYLLYIAVKVLLEPKLMGGTHGSAIPYIVMNDLAKFEILYDEEIFDKVSLLLKPMIEKIQSNNIANESLGKLRDTLLPKLMSGEIDVSEVAV